MKNAKVKFLIILNGGSTELSSTMDLHPKESTAESPNSLILWIIIGLFKLRVTSIFFY